MKPVAGRAHKLLLIMTDKLRFTPEILDGGLTRGKQPASFLTGIWRCLPRGWLAVMKRNRSPTADRPAAHCLQGLGQVASPL